jgi:nucleoside-diphosphate-sugar epimerase
MRIFVTGATGFVGSAIVRTLIDAGHTVQGLARSDDGARSLIAAGASVQLGALEDLAALRRGANEADAVIHAGFNHDFAHFAHHCEVDRQAIEAIGDALQSSDRPFIVTAGLPLVAGRPTTEDDLPASTGGSPRVSEQTAIALASRGVRASVVRMSQVHDLDKHGLATYLIALAKQKGVSAYVGTGLNRWPAVHRLDAATVYRLVLADAVAGGTYHAVAEEGVSLRAVAEAIGRGLNVPVVALSPDEAAAHFGWLAFPVSMDAPATSALTRQKLGWQPVATSGFLADLEQSRAFSP